MAEWLNRQLPSSTRVLASPARRAQQTAAALDRRVKTVPALAPDGSVEALLHAVRWPDSWAVRKGAVWWLRAREREGVRQVVLHAVMAPELTS